MLREIGEPGRAEPYLRAMLERGDRIMGFGHRAYKVRDPRAAVLEHVARPLFEKNADDPLLSLARAVEQTAVALLDEYKPGRGLRGASPTRAGTAEGAVHADVRAQPRGGMDGARARTA